ncbi:MAG: hypothetical protein H6739_17130 [Alphaproteobacteria bacterium]|nr:hypothetical protein [Alphaproteobacteria bacterium]
MLMLLLSLSLLPTATAAEVTDLPPWLRGDVRVGYDLGLQVGTLNEIAPGSSEVADVGRATREDHMLRLGGVFSAAPGAAVYFEVPIYFSSRLSFTDSYEMAYDPLAGRGSMVYGDPLNGTVSVQGSGAGGVWFGVRGTPFSEDLWENRGSRATWLIDLGFRTPDKSNFYGIGEGEGDRGGGNGASAFRLRNAFSTTKGVARPYIQGTWTRYGVVPVDLYDSEGALVTAGAEVQPGQRFDVLTGVQVRAFENPNNDASFDFDFRLGYDYNAWANVPSGLYLPSVMSSTEGTLVSMGEYSTASGGLGLYWRFFKYLQLDLRADVAYVFPHKLEHPYPIYTGTDTLEIRAWGGFKIMIR